MDTAQMTDRTGAVDATMDEILRVEPKVQDQANATDEARPQSSAKWQAGEAEGDAAAETAAARTVPEEAGS